MKVNTGLPPTAGRPGDCRKRWAASRESHRLCSSRSFCVIEAGVAISQERLDLDTQRSQQAPVGGPPAALMAQRQGARQPIPQQQEPVGAVVSK
jgi:hypothetical protein